MALVAISVNHTAPSDPRAIPPGWASAVGTTNSLILPAAAPAREGASRRMDGAMSTPSSERRIVRTTGIDLIRLVLSPTESWAERNTDESRRGFNPS
jgi:hypothetical protein